MRPTSLLASTRKLKRLKKHRQPLSPSVVALEGPFHHQMLHTRGLRLHAATAGDPQNPAIVLLHDSFGGWFDFRHVIGPLAEAGFHVAALDMRGYGLSDKPPSGYEHRFAAGDIAGSIRTLGHNSAHVIGVGSGASIAWLLAANYPDHVDSLLAVGALHPADMRRAIGLRPWLFSHILPMTMMFRLPHLLRSWCWSQRDRLIERDLRLTTGLSFHVSERFEQELRLRRRAMSIDSTFLPVTKTSRYSVNVPPVKWTLSKVQVPVHMLVDASATSAWLARRAHSRSAAGLSTSTVGGIGQRPHLENPEGFISEVLRFIRTI